ncbi:lytic murein transglycosylase [Sphingomonas sp. RHCKR7]|uniref:lytic murein transglycosylase n=1 Tax=Sphingomonas folli TaxID=2862497 RepID=UPI001C67E5FC|nr:lytic murein transglycosylase [Sphingomonas folli]MBW6525734.1 lytic murein transglycosylase [Sphingomonas folli]
MTAVATLARGIAATLLLLVAPASSAQGVAPSAAPDASGFDAYLAQVRARAVAAGVRPATADSALAGLSFNPRVVALDQRQPEARPNAPVPLFAPYRDSHVDGARISRGRATYAANRARLARVEAETGVPEQIMVAIWGHETNYGSYTGDFDLLRSLASLAYEGRRRPLFEGELIAALKMIDRGVPRSQLVGSWAGAMGNPQFLPSVYLRLARDGDGDGRADIWNSSADTLASIGNYFTQAGWRPGEPWGVAVSVPAGLARAGVANRLVSPRCPRVFERHSGWRTMAEWRALGVAPLDARWPGDQVQAVLIEPDGPGATAYLLTSNYRVILDYNCSNFYALSVGLLADAIAR